MKINHIHFKAVGPFYEQILDLAASDYPGLHVVAAPNEGGKSSALQAIKAFLYGFHRQTQQGFRFPYKQLTIGGQLQRQDGRCLTFYRRKKDKNDLRDSADNPLAAAEAAPFLPNVDTALFDSLYGIDHESLTAGGDDLLAYDGAIGQALFAAGAGMQDLKRALNELQQQSSQLYSPQARKKPLNQLLTDYAELENQQRQASLSAEHWQALASQLQQTEQEIAQLQQQRSQYQLQMDQAQRLLDALPLLSREQQLQQQLQGLEKACLPEDFSQQRRQLEEQRQAINTRLQTSQQQLQQVQERLQSLQRRPQLVTYGEQITALAQELGHYRQVSASLPKLQQQQQQLAQQAQTLCAAEQKQKQQAYWNALRRQLWQLEQLKRLAGEYDKLEHDQQHARQEVAKAENRCHQLQQQAPQKPLTADLTPLAQGISAVRQAGNVEEQIAQRQQRLQQQRRATEDQLQRLGLWPGSLEELLQASLPEMERVRRFEEQLRAYQQQWQQQTATQAQLAAEQTQVQEQRQSLQAGEAYITAGDLDYARRQRQQGWHLLLQRWQEQAPDVTAEKAYTAAQENLFAAYQHWVRVADEYADRLRLDADRLAQAAELQAKEQRLQAQQQTAARQAWDAAAARAVVYQNWLQLWHPLGIQPRDPQTMISWLQQAQQIRQQLQQQQQEQAECDQWDTQRRHLHHNLLQTLAEVAGNQEQPATLAASLSLAETCHEQLRRQQEQYRQWQQQWQQTDDNRRQAYEQLRQLVRRRRQWQRRWQQSLDANLVSRHTDPHACIAYLERLQQGLKAWDDSQQLQQQYQQQQQWMDQYSKQAGDLAALLAPELQHQSPPEILPALQQRLEEARQQERFYQEYQQQQQQLQDELQQVQAQAQSLHQAEQRLLTTARCEKWQQLDQAEARDQEYRQLASKLEQVREQLWALAAGGGLETLQQQAQQVTEQQLQEQITVSTQKLEQEVEPRITELQEQRGRYKNELSYLDGRATAAELAAQQQEVAAAVHQSCRQYLRLRVAEELLRREIDTYRSQQQGPLLESGSGIFAALTDGAFSGLRTDLADKAGCDDIIIVGVRANGERLPVEAMSSGTRDQLFLALRLAVLWQRLEQHHEPMPLIMDDILVTFDDNRARSTLAELARLGRRNQVLLFTHHQRVATDAAQLAGDYPVYVHGFKPAANGDS